MTAVTIFGRGDDWKECLNTHGDVWGTVTCLLTPGLADKPFNKVFAFDGDNFPEIKQGIQIARDRQIPIVSTLSIGTDIYPLREIVRDFKTSYFMNSISYMLAYAIYLKYDYLYLYGIGGRNRWDYEMGKHYILFWVGVGYGRNIDLHIGKGSSQWLYDKHNDMPRTTEEENLAWHEK